jgi:hypothetical protein
MIRMVSSITALLSLCLLTSCASPSYTYHAVVFDKSPGTIVAAGVGNAKHCKALFEPPGTYIGPHIDIPKDASIFGGLVVIRQGQVKVVPLYTWQDKAGVKKFGCNGPAPQFAHQGNSQEELMKSITKIIGEKE